MTLLRHGGYCPPCVAGDVPDARFGMDLLDRGVDCSPRAPGQGHPSRLPVSDHGSDLGHCADQLTTRSEQPFSELPENWVGDVEVRFKELA
jgi:hypothetical protein